MAELGLLAIIVYAYPSQQCNALVVANGLQNATKRWECLLAGEQ